MFGKLSSANLEYSILILDFIFTLNLYTVHAYNTVKSVV